MGQTKSLHGGEGHKVMLLGEELKESGRLQVSLKDELRALGESHKDEVSLLKEEMQKNQDLHASSLKSSQEGFAEEIGNLKEDILSLKASLDLEGERNLTLDVEREKMEKGIEQNLEEIRNLNEELKVREESMNT